VVHGFPTRERAGTETLTYNLSKEMANRNEVHVFYPVYKKGKGKAFIRSFTNAENIQIHELIVQENFRSYLSRILNFEFLQVSYKNKAIEQNFQELLIKIKPDVVHFQHLIGLSVLLPLIAKKYSPVVLTLNDYWLACLTTHFRKTSGENCQTCSPKECWACLSGKWAKSVEYLFNPIYKKLNLPDYVSHRIVTFLSKIYRFYGQRKIAKRIETVKQVIKTADKVISPSESIVNMLVENNIIEVEDVKKGKIVILSHGIDVENLRKVEKKPYAVVRFGYVGILTDRKGGHVLVEAFNKLGPVPAELKFYGNFDKSNHYYLNLLKESSGNKNIKFMQKFEDIKEPYSNFDVLVVPSVGCEGYGLVVQEAFAAKTPIIASDIGALNEFVKHMKNGLLFEAGNSTDLAQKMQLIINNVGLLNEFKNNIYEVKSIQENAIELEAIYNKVTIVYKNLFTAQRNQVRVPLWS
jgi:glycosyltransferase involved in cell wall biosynthesis